MATIATELRASTDADAAAIMRLQRLCFGVECPIDPRELGEGVEGLVCEWHDIVISYLLTSWALIPDQLTLLSIGVHPDFRRFGVATGMLKRLIEHSLLVGMPIRAMVGEQNLPFCACLSGLGFSSVHVFQGLYRFQWCERDQLGLWGMSLDNDDEW